MTRSHSSITLMACARSYRVASSLEFKNVDENFRFRDELAPMLTHTECNVCNQHCSYVSKLLANHLNTRMDDKNIMSINAK